MTGFGSMQPTMAQIVAQLRYQKRIDDIALRVCADLGLNPEAVNYRYQSQLRYDFLKWREVIAALVSRESRDRLCR